jgi:hypothetical protein
MDEKATDASCGATSDTLGVFSEGGPCIWGEGMSPEVILRHLTYNGLRPGWGELSESTTTERGENGHSQPRGSVK